MASVSELLTSEFAIFIPVVIIVIFTGITIWFYFRKDKYEPEPLRLIILAFLAGMFSALPAVILSLIVTFYTSAVSSILFPGTGIDLLVTIVVVAPVVEEFTKVLFVIMLSKLESFDGPLDGLIYGAMVGAGFALTENLLYAYTIFFDESIAAGIFVAVLRSVTQIVGHPFYTGLAGVGVGEFKVGMTTSRYSKIWRAIGFHALWNFSGIFGIPVVFASLSVVVAINIYVLRNELKRAIKLDKLAYERGYYEQKRRYLEMKRKQLQDIIYGPKQVPPTQLTDETTTEIQSSGTNTQEPINYASNQSYDMWQYQPSPANKSIENNQQNDRPEQSDKDKYETN